MFEFIVINTDSGDELFTSSKISECRLFAKSYSKENCTPCTISVVCCEEHYINGQKSDV